MLAPVFLDSQSTNYDSRNALRFAHHVQHPVQKQGRPVPNQRIGQADRLKTTRSRHFNAVGEIFGADTGLPRILNENQL